MKPTAPQITILALLICGAIFFWWSGSRQDNAPVSVTPPPTEPTPASPPAEPTIPEESPDQPPTIPPVQPPIKTPPPPVAPPPAPVLSAFAGDRKVTVATPWIPNADNATYTLLASFSASALETLQTTGEKNSFDAPPIGALPLTFLAPLLGNPAVIPVSADTPSPALSGEIAQIANYLIVSNPGKVTVGNLPNNTTVYFRLRRCVPSAGCVATDVVSATATLAPVHVALGERETVFDWTTDRCEDLDLPDSNARAIRMPNGTLNLFSVNAPAHYRMTGTNFNNLKRDCSSPVLVSNDDLTPASFNNYEWLWSFYRIGSTIHALIHNEYHDPELVGCKAGDTSPGNPCWYNSVTYAKSTNNGKTFTQNTANADHVVAALPKPWESYGAPDLVGYTTPTNIIKSGGYYYSIISSDVSTTSNASAGGGHCLIRTNNISNPKSWRAWDGKSFSLTLYPPYAYPNGTPQATGLPPCAPIFSPLGVNQSGGGSLTWNTYLHKYLLAGYGKFAPQGSLLCGFYLSYSDDLILWSEPQLLMAGNFPIGGACPAPNETVGTYGYPSLIDHTEFDANFERTDRTPYLYYMVYNGIESELDRDLVRAPLTFTKE